MKETPDQHRQRCKNYYHTHKDHCVRVARAWREKNKDKVKLLARTYYLQNQEMLKPVRAAWRRKNRYKVKAYRQEYYLKNRQEILERNRRNRIRNRDAHNQVQKQYKLANAEKISNYMRVYHLANKVSRTSARRDREKRLRRTSPRFAIDCRMRNGIYYALRGRKGGKSWSSLVGYDSKQLKSHIESLFTTGMSWARFLKGHIEIDHRIPRASFTYQSPEDPQFKKCWDINNLQPMWKTHNQRKSDTMPDVCAT